MEETQVSTRYDEGIEDAELDLEASGLSARKLLVRAESTLAQTEGHEKGLVEYRRGRRDRLKEAEQEARDARSGA